MTNASAAPRSIICEAPKAARKPSAFQYQPARNPVEVIDHHRDRFSVDNGGPGNSSNSGSTRRLRTQDDSPGQQQQPPEPIPTLGA